MSVNILILCRTCPARPAYKLGNSPKSPIQGKTMNMIKLIWFLQLRFLTKVQKIKSTFWTFVKCTWLLAMHYFDSHTQCFLSINSKLPVKYKSIQGFDYIPLIKTSLLGSHQMWGGNWQSQIYHDNEQKLQPQQTRERSDDFGTEMQKQWRFIFFSRYRYFPENISYPKLELTAEKAK